MRLYTRLLCLLSCALGAILTGCGSVNDVRIIEGRQEPISEATVIANDAAIIVHIDVFERIATIRNGTALEGEFLIATDYAGLETGVLKVRESDLSEHLRAVDILEGSPEINNSVRPANAARSQQLAQTYRSAGADN